MPEREANRARFFFEAAQLPEDTFEVLDFVGKERISRPFQFEVNLVSEDPEIAFGDVIDQTATLTMMRQDEEYPIHGIVSDLRQGGRTADWYMYTAILVPRLWRLTLSYRDRIFQNMTVEDIVRDVLKEAGFSNQDFRFSLNSSYDAREYCVQYEETDLNFVSRLLEHEGIQFFFEHGDDKEEVVFADHDGENPDVEGERSLQYHSGAGMVPSETETVREFVYRERVGTGKVKLKDYDYEGPKTIESESQISSSMPGTRYEFGPNMHTQKEGDRLAEVRNEEIECQRRMIEGAGNCLRFRAGQRFELAEHYRGDLNAEYLITEVRHEGSQRAGLGLGEGEAETGYRNGFSCLRTSVPYRPPRETPKPEAPGVLTAKTESAGGDYAYLDDQGRYRAKMHFDERSGRSEGKKTPPIRMKQANTGPDYGIHFPNHADTEMLVAFENGDIDRPVALGTTPNPSQSSPVTSENNTQNLIRSSADNEVLVEDQEGETEIRLTTTGGHVAKMFDGDEDKGIFLLSSGERTIGMNDDTERMGLASADGHNITIADEGAEGDEGIGAWTKSDHSIILNDTDNFIKSETKKGNLLRLDDKNKSAKLKTEKGHVVELSDKDKKISVSSFGGHSITVEDSGDSKGVSVSTKSGHSVQLLDNEEIINIETAGGNVINMDDNDNEVEIEVGRNEIEIDGSKNKVEVEAGSEIKLKCGKSSISLKKSGKIQIKGMNIEIKGTKSVKMKGMNIESKANMKNDVKGTMVNSKAKGVNTIKGSVTKIG